MIEEYPEFKAMYKQAYRICRNMEDVMGIFSEELRILDRNTVQYMIDEMQDTIDAQKVSLAEKEQEISEKEQQIAELQRRLAEFENK